MNFQLSNRQTIALLAGSFFIALGVGSGLKLWLAGDQATTTIDSVEEPVSADSTIDRSTTQPFNQSFLGAKPELRLPEPALLRSTPQEERVITVAAGRSNPYAPITRPSLSAADNRNSDKQESVASTTSPQTIPTVPVGRTSTLPPLPTVPRTLPPADTSPRPTVAVAPNSDSSALLEGQGIPSNLTPLPTSPVDRVEISGVVQLSGNVRVIIREVGADTSRHVSVGDRIAGGQVQVQDVDLSGTEPVVVLRYNGQEFYRSIGSASLAGLL